MPNHWNAGVPSPPTPRTTALWPAIAHGQDGHARAACKLAWLLFLTLLVVCLPARAARYYLDATSGNGARSGLSPAQAWRWLERVNATVFQPGDEILLKISLATAACARSSGRRHEKRVARQDSRFVLARKPPLLIASELVLIPLHQLSVYFSGHSCYQSWAQIHTPPR
ncbi:MAG: hypothetical protein WBO19_06110 [Terriglobia bacterium]|jgi:hypothetical protein